MNFITLNSLLFCPLGFLMIFDARDLRLLSHVTGTDVVLNGLHAKFFWDSNAPAPTQPGAASFVVPSILTLLAATTINMVL